MEPSPSGGRKSPWAQRIRNRGRRLQRAIRGALARYHPAPLFVLGNQKSGTTAIAALLGEMTGHAATLDLRQEIRRPLLPAVHAGRLPLEAFLRANRYEFSRPIIKEPHLTPFYLRLAGRFPQARFLFIVRDPRENLRSILNRLRLPGNQTVLTDEQQATITPAWRLVTDGRWLGLASGNYIEMLARRWCLCAEIYLRHAEAITLLRYEDFLADKTEAIRSLAASLGWAERHDIRARLDVQFQPAGDRAVSWQAFFGDENLGSIVAICAPQMERFGYVTGPAQGTPVAPIRP